MTKPVSREDLEKNWKNAEESYARRKIEEDFKYLIPYINRTIYQEITSEVEETSFTLSSFEVKAELFLENPTYIEKRLSDLYEDFDLDFHWEWEEEFFLRVYIKLKETENDFQSFEELSKNRNQNAE